MGNFMFNLLAAIVVDSVKSIEKIIEILPKDIMDENGNIKSKSLYLEDNNVFIQENLTHYALSKILPKEQFEQIKSLTVKDNVIYIVHSLLGLIKITPHSLEFKDEYTLFDYTMIIEQHVEQRNRKLLLGFCAVLVGGICLTLTSGLLGVGILAAGATYMAKAQLSHSEYIGVNKKYYMPSLLTIISDQSLTEVEFIKSFFNNPLSVSCNSKYIVLNLSNVANNDLMFIKEKIEEFLKLSFSENSSFLPIGEKFGYTIKNNQ
jgi:hypothetical protein